MSDASGLFHRAQQLGFTAGGASVALLREAADAWREADNRFSAGYAMTRAFYAVWGDAAEMVDAANIAIADFQGVIRSAPHDSAEGLAAFVKLRSLLYQVRWLLDADHVAAVGTLIDQLQEELAQRLLTHFSASPHAANYLVRGVLLTSDLNGTWETTFTEYEVVQDEERYNGVRVTFALPSAFSLFVARGDWQGAHSIIDSHSGAFSTPGLRGWRNVARAYVEPARAVEHFDDAANELSSDVIGEDIAELHKRGGSWSGENAMLWAKYFRSRARLLQAIREPEDVARLIRDAAVSLTGTESGFQSAQVNRFRVLVNTLATFISEPASIDLARAKKDYLAAIRFEGANEDDRFAIRFLEEAAAAVQIFSRDPATALTTNRLPNALDALARFPLVGEEITAALATAVGHGALQLIHGRVVTWMHRTLAGIRDEAALRQLLLRLLQASLPLYTQVRHGPIEYGKDVVALVQVGDDVTLRLYAVKCGDLDRRKWRESKDELDELFQVPLSSFQLPAVPTRIEGVLFANGHATPHTEPAMEGYFAEQRAIRGRNLTFMHLDAIVGWIVEQRLINEMKLALADLGIPVV